MNKPIKVELCFEMIKNRITISEFTWDFRDFITKFMYITRVWNLLECPDIAYNIQKILINFTREKEQLGHILMIIIKLMMGTNNSKYVDLPRIDLIKNKQSDHFISNLPQNFMNVDNFYNCLNESIYKHATNGALLSIRIKPRINGGYSRIDYDKDLIKILDWTEENCDEHYLDVIDVICKSPKSKTDSSSDIMTKGIMGLLLK